MSGPKISVYELSGWARKVVLGQIRCERDSSLCAAQIKKLVQEAISYKGELRRIMDTCDLMKARGLACSIDSERVPALVSLLDKESQAVLKALSADAPHISQKYEISDDALEKKKAQLARLVSQRKKITDLRDSLDRIVFENREAVGDSDKHIEESIIDSLSGTVSFEYMVPEEKDGKERFALRKQKVESYLRALSLEQGLPAKIQTEIRRALITLDTVSTADKLSTFDLITVKGLGRRIQQYKESQAALRATYEDSIERYRVLCEMCGEAAVSFPLSEESIKRMDEEIKRLELQALRQKEQSYISESVDEVMRDMGYDLIGTQDVKKKSGKQFHNELYTFREGTGVNITYSSDGQIAMELGGLSREDRMPNAEETKQLTENMVSFCGEFSEFEQRLREKGIVLGSRIALSPPSEQYAAIINIEDYDMDSSKTVSVLQVANKKNRRSENNAVRRMD